MTQTFQSPAKMILSGEHIVVYGYPAIVAAVELYATLKAEIEQGSAGNLTYRVPRLNIDFSSSWEDLLSNKVVSRGKSVQRFLTVLIEEIAAYYDLNLQSLVGKLPSGDVEMDLGFPVGGFGSSTASAKTLVEFLLFLLKDSFSEPNMANPTLKDVYEILVRAESRLQGYQVSGADQTIVLQGGFIKYQKRNGVPEYSKMENVGRVNPLIINSGRSDSNTGEVVARVGEWRELYPKKYKKLFEEIAGLNEELIDVKNGKLNYEKIARVGEYLIEMGIVTDSTKELIEKLSSMGGYLKVSGAGSIKGQGSGAVLCFVEGSYRESIKEYLLDKKIEFFEAKLGAKAVNYYQ
jgi:mevalonate kinase